MLCDGREVAGGATLDADVCIVGGGPAGLATADALTGRSLRICLLETGSGPIEDRHQELSTTETDDNEDVYLNARYYRARGLGGTANRWCITIGGEPHVRLARLHPADLDHRPWYPLSGWPLTIGDLDPWYRAAGRLCGVGALDAGPHDRRGPDRRPVPFPSGRAESTLFTFCRQRRFSRELPARLADADDVELVTDATAVELLTDPEGCRVAAVRTRTLAGNEFLVRARAVVLAQGGFEVPRLLLASRDHHPAGIGNRHDLVGRFLMDHQILKAGRLHVTPAAQCELGFYDIDDRGDHPVAGALTLSDKVVDSEHLTRSAFLLAPRPARSVATALQHPFGRETTVRSPAFRSAVALRRALKYGRRPPPHLARHLGHMVLGADDLLSVRTRSDPFFRPRYSIDDGGWSDAIQAGARHPHFDLFQVAEQRPDPENRIALATTTDRLGVPRARIRFQWGLRDRADAKRSQEILAEELREAGLGPTSLQRRRGEPLVRQISTHHPAGTTRMADDPAEGVVDRECRVHGMENLWVASGSVFPTCGHAPPTLTILALALRVAELVGNHLA